MVIWNKTSNIYTTSDNSKWGNDIRKKYSHEMTQFGFESLSGLHCTNQYASSDHPMGRSLNRHSNRSITGTNLNLLQWVRISPNGSETLQHATQPWIHANVHPYTYTRHIYTCIHMHTHVCPVKHTTYIYVLMYTTYIYYIYIPTHAYTIFIHIYTLTWTHTLTYTPKH